MFENINTLEELNKARAAAVAQRVDQFTLNSAYNSARARIVSSSVKFTQIPVYERTTAHAKVFCAFPIIGFSEKAGCIEFTEKGVKI